VKSTNNRGADIRDERGRQSVSGGFWHSIAAFNVIHWLGLSRYVSARRRADELVIPDFPISGPTDSVTQAESAHEDATPSVREEAQADGRSAGGGAQRAPLDASKWRSSASLRIAAVAAIIALALWFWLRPDTHPAIVSAEDIPPTPTGLAARLAVINPGNANQVQRLPTPVSVVLPTPTSAWPESIVVVTPTPRSAQERLLFADPLVADAAREDDAVQEEQQATEGDDLAEKPLIIRAMAAEANLGNAIDAPSLEVLARPRILPALAVALIPDRLTPTPTIEPIPTVPPVILEPGRVWASFAPAPGSDHFWVGRSFPAFVQNQIAAPSYQFGSTGGSRYRPHHGMDIANPSGTPVRAATTGEVIHAGLDDPELLGPYNRFYGNAVVIRLDRRLPIAGGELDVFLLYGHLSQVVVSKGQRVQPDDIVGMVGMTGIAIGPHLHVEMRVGSNTYQNSVNPYLWVEPPPGTGAVAVRLLTADGRTWPGARVTLARFEGNVATWGRVIEIYPDNESINPNPVWGENGAMDTVPAGFYYLGAVINGERVTAQAEVRAGQTTFVEMRTAK
jgi:murein DD-endopeptidase MepM/ murein hydrolase activator NlpD